jgi:hypothetical protein
MARSYRKNPIVKDASKYGKKMANRKVRRTKEGLPNGTLYRKVYPQYDVCEWSHRKTFGEAVADWYADQAPHSVFVGDEDPKDVVKNWAKGFYWK